jgi:hypothetical protein
MEFEYFKVYLKGLPDSVLKQRGRKKILHLRVASLAGPVEIEFSAGDVIRTDDWKTAAALSHYRVPKVGIKHKPKGEKKFKHAYHDHEDHKKLRVFKKTKKTDKFHHEVGA